MLKGLFIFWFAMILFGLTGLFFYYMFVRMRNDLESQKNSEIDTKPAKAKVTLVIHNVMNPEIVEEFITKFNLAHGITSMSEEYLGGKLVVGLDVKNSAISEQLKEELKAKGFEVEVI